MYILRHFVHKRTCMYIRRKSAPSQPRDIDACNDDTCTYAASRKTYLPSACTSWIICWIFAERGRGTPGIFPCADGIFPPGAKSADADLKKSHSRLKIHRGRRACWTSEKAPSTEIVGGYLPPNSRRVCRRVFFFSYTAKTRPIKILAKIRK